MNDDGILVRRCLAGDEDALRELVQRFQGAVFGLCCRMLRHRQDAEDVAQEVFLRAFRGLAQWNPDRPLQPWLMTIAANRCRTALRRRAAHAAAPFDERDAGTAFPRRADPPAGELAEELEQALGRLREEYRQCFILFHQGELSCARIGRIMGHPAGTIKSWLFRARRELAAHLTRREEEWIQSDRHHGTAHHASYELQRIRA